MIDYDGINFLIEEMQDEALKKMIDLLTQAMCDEEIEPCKITYVWVICDSCNGHGTHSRHLGVISHETLDEWEDDQWSDYVSGRYDKQCFLCDGAGKVKEIDSESLNDSAKDWINSYMEDVYDDIQNRKGEMIAGA